MVTVMPPPVEPAEGVSEDTVGPAIEYVNSGDV